MSLSAVILAGGQSSRMGRDKAFLEYEGETLLQRQIATAQAAGAGEILISGRSDTDYSQFGVPVVHDLQPEAGPLAGIYSALLQTRSSRLLVLAVDLPQMTPDFLRRLAGISMGGGVIPRVAGEVEPLATIYPSAAKQLAGNLLMEKKYSVRGLASDCVMASLAVYADFPGGAGQYFRNCNSPADWPLEETV